MRMMKRPAPSGFTLMELLIVVIIIGILATLALPQFTKFVDQAREAEALNVIGSGLTGQFVYFQEKGKFTDNTIDLAVQLPEMKYWNFETGTFPDFKWTTTTTTASITANSDHGHKTATDHQIRGTIDNNGNRILEHKRQDEPSFKPF